MSQESLGEVPNEEIFTILFATDNHLGYLEKDSIRGNDSFVTFEEILQRAVEQNVDFILLGGNLFHVSNPSSNTLHRCIELLRTYTLGEKTIDFEFLSDQSKNFTKSVNYEDNNINISIPIFSIHGNQDGSSLGGLSALDILSTSRLINYFGKWPDLNNISISPILLQKGETKLALYGLSHINDCRFTDSKIVVEIPKENQQSWFNLMILHQNRTNPRAKDYLNEDNWPTILKLIIWGHEHQCSIEAEKSKIKDFSISQPGSTIATSFSDGESRSKHCGLLKIYKKRFDIVPIKLETVRPFVYDKIDLTEYTDEISANDESSETTVKKIVKQKIEEMLEASKEQITLNPRQPMIPLIRLEIRYTDENHVFNAIRFGQEYQESVANSLDMICFKKKNQAKSNSFNAGSGINQDYSPGISVEESVEKLFEGAALDILPAKCLSEFTRQIVYKNDNNASENIVEWMINSANNYLLEKFPSEEELDNELSNYKSNQDEIYKNMMKMLDKRQGPRNPVPVDGQSSDRGRSGRKNSKNS